MPKASALKQLIVASGRVQADVALEPSAIRAPGIKQAAT